MSSSERPSDPPADLNEATSTATADPSVAAEPAKKKRKDLTFAHVKPLKLPTGEEVCISRSFFHPNSMYRPHGLELSKITLIAYASESLLLRNNSLPSKR